MAEELRDWDIVSGVGITALGVAAARALEASRREPLVRDPFAADFVHAAESPVPMPTSLDEAPTDQPVWDFMALFMGLRSRFLDEYFADVQGSGLTQVVILASGLDTRAFRLPWDEGTTVYEIDQPRVLEFKDRVLAGRDARPGCERHVVPVDLRDDWRSALLETGFDPAQPTAWLAEGLMMYLPDDAADRLLTTVDELSAPESAIAVEYTHDMQSILADSSELSLANELGIDFSTLLPDVHLDPNARLAELGWAVADLTARELGERYERTLPADIESFVDKGHYLTARKA